MELPRRILVAGDDETTRRAIIQIGRGFKLDMIEALTGRQAYAALLVGDAALAFIDVDLPDMSAFEVVRRVHAANLHVRAKLIALSHSMSSSEHAACADAGFDAHILKPIDPDRIAALLFALQSEPRS